MAVKSLCHWLIDSGYIETNPARSIRMGHPKDPPIRFLTAAQRAELLTFFRRNCGKRWGLFGAIVAETGARAGEIRTLRWCQCQNGAIIIRASKTQMARTVPVAAWLRGILQSLAGPPDAYLFPGQGAGPVTPSCTSEWLREARRHGPDFRWSWKVLRPTYATTLISRGVPVEVVSRLLGHTSVDMTLRHYGYLRPEPWFERVTQALAEDSTEGG